MVTIPDNVSIDQDGVGGTDFTAATDDIGGVHYQKVKLVDGTADSTTAIPGDATNGLDVDVTRLPVLATGSKVQLTDGTSDATVRNLAANDALNVAIVDASGNHVTSFGGSGGTSSSDDADFTQSSTTGTPAMGVYESTPTSVTDNDMGIVGITATRALKVDVSSSSIDVAHDAADSGNPVKTGARAVSALPAAVTANDRANNISDLFGRLLVTPQIAPEMQVWKSARYTTTQTGTVIWDPTAGKRIAITHFTVGTGGTTAGRLLLWFGANGDTAYTAGTDQLVFDGAFAPAATVTPGAVVAPAVPIYSLTADYELHATTDANLTVGIAVYGYEF